jgi:hypothetical protein
MKHSCFRVGQAAILRMSPMGALMEMRLLSVASLGGDDRKVIAES